MKVKPILDNWEIPNIARMDALEHRSLVELRVPGRVGSLFQDLNTAPTRVAISGSLFGDDARADFVDQLRGKFRAGDPVTFVADIVTATEVQYVLIETLHFEESGNAPDEVAYRVVLTESPAPSAPGGGALGATGDFDAGALAGIDSGLLDDATSFVETAEGALGAIEALEAMPNLQDPTEQLTPAVAGVEQAVSGLTAALKPLKEILGDG
jgi:hypothetical protein